MQGRYESSESYFLRENFINPRLYNYKRIKKERRIEDKDKKQEKKEKINLVYVTTNKRIKDSSIQKFLAVSVRSTMYTIHTIRSSNVLATITILLEWTSVRKFERTISQNNVGKCHLTLNWSR